MSHCMPSSLFIYRAAAGQPSGTGTGEYAGRMAQLIAQRDARRRVEEELAAKTVEAGGLSFAVVLVKEAFEELALASGAPSPLCWPHRSQPGCT
jgi:hypothetical protein